MKCPGLTLLCLILLGVCSSMVAAVEPSPEDLLNGAMNSWRSGDVEAAREQFTEIIQNGSEDPRVYYFRGILAEQQGEKGDADFREGAELEVAMSAASRVNRAIEKTQGSLRAKIEKFRAAARDELNSDPETARLKTSYREALNARAEGNLAKALARFEDITSIGTDPRYFYMHGVTLAEMGEAEKAREAFAEGLKRETTPEDVELVNLALADIQGEVRRLIEEETVVESGEELITRQKNQREVARRAAMTAEEFLADANAASIAAEQRAEEERAARRTAAANQIIAERKAREELESKISKAPPIPPDPDEPAVAAAEPLNLDTASPEPDAPVPTPGTSANPFLGGPASAPASNAPAVSSVTPGPIDMSYLPAATEYLMYVRPADMLNSQFVKPLTDMPQFEAALAQMSAQLGFTPSDIDSVTMGMSNVMATMLPVIAQASSGTPPNPAALTQQMIGGENAITIIRTTTDIDFNALTQASNGTEGSHQGKSYLLLQTPDPAQPQMAVYAIDARTFVFASEPGVKAVISNGAGEPANDAFAFVSRSSHMVQAFSSPLLAGMSAGIPDAPEGVPPQVGQLLAAIRGNIAGAAIVLEAGSDLKFNVVLNLTDSSAASEANTALTGGLVMAKQAAPLFLGSAPPELQPSLTQALNSLSSSSSQSVVSVSLNIPGSLVQTLKDNPQLLGPVMAAQAAAENASQSNNLKQIAIAMHMYHDNYNTFPAADGNARSGAEKSTGLSWRVYILPLLDQRALYEQFHLDEPWDSDHNQTLIPQMPDVFRVPEVTIPGYTSVQVFSAANCPFDPAKPSAMKDIVDGTSTTIMAVVAGPEAATPWTQPGGLPFDPSNPILALGTVADLIQVCLCDGSVRSISKDIDPQTLSNLIQHADGNPIGNF